MSRPQACLGSLVLGLALSALAGCSYDDVPLGVAVSGHVTFEGKPVHEGLICFYPPSDQQGRGCSGRIKNGYYSIPRHEGPYPGPTDVQVLELEKTHKKTLTGEDELKITRRIPKIYNFYTTLRVEMPDRTSMVYSFNLPAEHRVETH